jgi:hypothetical protein
MCDLNILGTRMEASFPLSRNGGMTSQVANAERLLHDTLALVDRNVLRSLRVSLKERKRKLACAPLAPFVFPHFLLSLFLHHLSWGSANTPVLQAGLTQVQEAAAAAEVAHVVAVLDVETSAKEAAVA